MSSSPDKSPERRIAKEGLLVKRGGVRHNWLPRKFVLKNASISYYADGVFKGSVPTAFVVEVRRTFPDVGNKTDRKQVCLCC